MWTISLSDEKFNQKSGSLLKVLPLYGIVKSCKDYIKDDGQKGKHGQIFAYINNRLGKEYWPEGKIYNDCVIFCDIDNITKECAEAVFGAFDDIKEIFTSLLGIQYSSSYYTSAKKAGLHIYIASFELDNNDYEEQATLAYMVLFRIIEMVTGIDLRKPQIWDDENSCWAKIIDLHNVRISQRFNLYYSDYRWNENAQAFNTKEWENNFGRLKEYYKDFITTSKNKINLFDLKETNLSDDYEGSWIDLDEKIKVDRNLVVGKYSGSDLRWRIAAIANAIFKDKAKEWCDKYFFFEDGKSIWQATKYEPNNLVLNWLINKGLINNCYENKISYEYNGDGDEVKTWLNDEYKDKIQEAIEAHKAITIVGDPGIGKTYCLGKMAKENKWAVMTPYNQMRRLYEKNGLTIINHENRDEFDFENNGCVFVYDQLPKVKDKIHGKTIIIDESHVLFKDRLYRNTLITVLDILKEWTGKIIVVSATPLEETKILNSEMTLKFWKRRAMVDLIWRNCENINDMKFLADKVIMGNLDDERYTHICLFGNRSPRMIYDNLTVKYGRQIHNKVNMLHRDYEENGDIDRVTSTEILDKKVNLGTSLVFNGLNFNNEGAKILVVVEYEEGSTGWWDIVQTCTRIRKSKVIVYVIAARDTTEDAELDLDMKIEDAKWLNSMGIDKNLIGYDHNYVDNEAVVRELNEFEENNCSIEYGIQFLKENIKWMKINVMDEDFKSEESAINILRKRIDMILKKQLNGKELTEDELETIKDGKEYYDMTLEEINQICLTFGIDKEDVINLNNSEMIESENRTRTVTLRTTMDHIRYNTKAAIDPIEYWESIDKILEKKKDGPVLYLIRKKNIKDIIDTHKKWHDKYFSEMTLINSNGYGDVKGMIHDMIEENKKNNEEKKTKRSEAGKKGGKKGGLKGKKKVKDMETGIVYESCEACAKAIGKSNAYVTKYRDRFVRL